MAHKGGHGYPKTKKIREERREQAEALATETGYSKLTTQEKLERVLAFIAVPGNGAAKKQRARLEKLLSKEKVVEPVAQAQESKKVKKK